MRIRLTRTLLLTLAFIIALAPLAAVSVAEQSDDSEIVAFNTKSFKYHCKSCTWAKRCTANCIDITKREAKARGGVACKVCGGGCR